MQRLCSIFNESGVILISVLVFLTILSCVILSALEISLLETKMAKYSEEEWQAYYAAQTKLVAEEKTIFTGNLGRDVALIDNHSICGVAFYKVNVSATVNTAVRHLMSTVAKVDTSANCNPKPVLKKGRQSFVVLENEA